MTPIETPPITPALPAAVAPARNLTGNTLILLVNNIGGAGLAFLMSVIIGRALGAEGLGQYSFIMAWLSPLIMFADFGMGSLITRDVARTRDSALMLLHTATRCLLLIAGGTLISAWLIIPTMRESTAVTAGLMLAALLVILDPWYGLYTALFRAFERMWPIPVLNIGGLVLQIALMALAIRAGWGLVGIIAALVVINVVQLLATWIIWRGMRVELLPLRVDMALRPTLRNVLRRAWPFALAAVLFALQARLNILLLQHLSGDAAVGWYSAANRFVEAGRMIPNAFFGALFPALSGLAANPDRMRRVFVTATGRIVAFGIAAGLGLTIFGGVLLRLTYDPQGSQFAGAVPVLALLGWTLLPSLVRNLITLYLYSLGYETFVNRVMVGALIVQAVLGWLLISRYGAVGAAITLGLVEGGAVIWLLISLRFGFGRR